jgi:hypothetical protein
MSDTDAAFSTVNLDFASNACSTCFPDGLPGPGDDPTSPISFSDYTSMTAINNYSNLEYLEYRTTLGVRHQFHDNIGIFGAVSYYNLDDKQPYLQNATGEVTLISGGLTWTY